MGDIEIAYQNKDITSKVLAEHFRGKTFRVYGLELPQIVQVLPTNLPAVKIPPFLSATSVMRCGYNATLYFCNARINPRFPAVCNSRKSKGK